MKHLFSSNKNKALPFCLVILAVAIQIQITLFQNETYNGLRLNLADITLPILGIFILINLLIKKTTFPQFHIPHAIIWLILLGGALVSALLHGYLRYGELNQWAFVNKTVGWGVLCAYFLLGGWFANQMDKEKLLLFIKFALYTFIAISTLQFLQNALHYSGIISLKVFPMHPASGAMGNKNSYILLFLSLLSFGTLYCREITSEKILYFFYSLLPIALFFTVARAAFIISPLLILTLFILKQNINWKKIGMALALSFLTIFILSNITKHNIPAQKSVNYDIVTKLDKILEPQTLENIDDSQIYLGDTYRLKVLDTALNMIKENPIIGNGLGSISKKQVEDWGLFMNILDCTPLWLWAETGLIGLLLFLSFYFICLRTLYKNGFNKKNSKEAQNLNKSVFLMLIIFGIMSLFHELLYTRFMWFFMGLALAYPLTSSAEHQN